MRTGTGIVESTDENGFAKVRMNRNNLYTPCSASMGQDNALIDAVNTACACKGQYVKFTIPDQYMAVGGIVCFGVPLLLVIIGGIAGYWLGSTQGYRPELTAFACMIAGGLAGAGVMKKYEKILNTRSTKAEIIDIVVEKTMEME